MAIIGTGFGQGSSSSSSTLSPLAQPFTVNRPAPNPKSSPPRRPLIDNYFPSHDPNPTWPWDSSSHLNGGVGFAQRYAYFDSQSIGSCGTHLPSLSANSHDFPYVEHLDSIGSNVTEADPYYLQYQPATLDANSGVMQEPSYVILNSGTSAPLEGSSQTNFIQSSTGFGIAPKWTDQWKDVGASSSWKEPKGNVDFPYRSPLQLGAISSEGFISYDDAPAVCYGSFVESSARKDHVGLTGTGSEGTYAKHLAIPEVNSSLPFNISGPSVLFSSTMQETAYSHIPDTSGFIPSASTSEETMYSRIPKPLVLVPPTVKETMYSHMPEPSVRNSWDPFNQNIASYDRCFAPLDSCTTEPTIFLPSTTVPAIFSLSVSTQPVPSADGSSSLLGEVVLKDMKSCDQPMDTFTKKDSGGQVSVKIKAPTTTLSTDTSKIKNDMGKYDYISMETSSAKSLPLNQKAISNNSSIVLSKNEIELKLTPLKIQAASTLTTCIDGSGDFVESSDALDQLNSAVDSPCWKGTSSRYSSFSVFNAEHPISLAKDPEECSDLSRHGQFFSVNEDGEESVSSPEPCGSFNNHRTRGGEEPSLTMKHPSVVCSLPVRPELNDAVEKVEPGSSKAGNKYGAQFSEGFPNTGNGYVLSNAPASNSGCQTSHVMPLSHKDVSSVKPMSQIANKDLAMDFNAVQYCSPDFCSHKDHACNASTKGHLPDEADGVFRASVMSNQQSVPRLDVSILVKAIHSLSELLTSSHFYDANALKENDCEVICLAINNLVGLARQLPKLITEVGSSNCIRESTDLCKDTNALGSHLATEVESDDGLSLGGHLRSLCKDGIMHSCFCRSRKKVDKIGVVAKSDEIDFDEDVRIMQAVKKAINQNIPQEEDNCLQTLLFKNLWIEAVTALCSIKYELQLAHVQIEIEKSKQLQTKATDSQTSIAAGKTTCVKNNLCLNGAGGIGWKERSAAEANKGPTVNTPPNKSSNRNAPEMNRSDSNVLAENGDLSSMNSKKLAQQFPASILIGKNVSSDMVSSPSAGGKYDVDIKENQMKAADLGSIEVKKPSLRLKDQNRTDMLRLVVNHTGESSGLDASEKHRMARGSRICVGDEASTWPYMPDQPGNLFPAIGFLPSDWEHVRK